MQQKLYQPHQLTERCSLQRCSENAMKLLMGEGDSGQTSPELPKSPPTSRKLPFYAVYPNYSDVENSFHQAKTEF